MFLIVEKEIYQIENHEQAVMNLENMHETLNELEAQKSQIERTIASIRLDISERKEKLRKVEYDIFGDIDERARKCLELEKSISLLNFNLSKYQAMLVDVEIKIPPLQKRIQDLNQHLQLLQNTNEIRQALEPFIELEQQYLEKRDEIDQMLRSKGHYLGLKALPATQRLIRKGTEYELRSTLHG
ncbi:hypothetical protein DP114_31795 [Brasilonema sennae CENA114]|uniref:Uncharacterized protein n=1 Tax=Brasilonema sennae CENA114 TaxID=415709 RepID=A0A856MNZ5_9CYAN|nr:hypothetical protein [Brasilonema sennae]QDL11874.1 hypothetical protein DP114_31795 [Brasilonema sennae CENA114]